MTKQQPLSAFANPHCGVTNSQIRPILVKVRAVDVQVVHFCRQDLLEQLHVMRLLAEVGIYESGQEPVRLAIAISMPATRFPVQCRPLSAADIAISYLLSHCRLCARLTLGRSAALQAEIHAVLQL